ncbi:Elongation of very long chain fatty acids protein 6 [Orchesella cincta]|uniref:Elongation of very long chain fatty acids protein n=1 Tax=Orchesella cincta TaxID=48709 RepID=A0A1D2MZ08_ORCCI|nr:Elongation of very long chain fatty acids protein 6 [Orchesella cincta]
MVSEVKFMMPSSVHSNIRYIAPFSRNLTSPYDPVLDPPYLTVWDIEKFSLDYWRVWLGVNWTWSVYISGIYLSAIFGIQLLMKNRPPFSLRNVLTGWNFFLAVFSLLGAMRTFPEMMYILTKNEQGFFQGFHLSVCQRYHHITVLGYTWFTYESYDATSRWFMVMNYMVHSLMYTYYGLKSLRISVPRFVSMLITTLQLSQMIVGVFVNVYAYYVKTQGVNCLVETKHINLALIMYVSYFILFGNFFYNAYFIRKRMSMSAKKAK